MKTMSNINQKGQMIIILLLVMLVSLSIGVAITQRATSNLATSTQSEQSSQAFSAAEAGIETALNNPLSSQIVNLGNNSKAQVATLGKLPTPGDPIAIEYPPVGKEVVTQFSFEDPSYPYQKPSFEVWFGNCDVSPPCFNLTDNIAPAVEVNVISYDESIHDYKSSKYYFDFASSRALKNNFNNCVDYVVSTDTILKRGSPFACRVVVPPASGCKAPCGAFISPASLVRVRLLYANQNQKIALVPINGFFPPQVEIFNSTGTAGQSQATVQVFRSKDLVPPWFDFAVFSLNSIKK